MIARVAFGEAQLTSKEAGLGKKSAEAFRLTSDPDELYKDSRASGSDKNLSRKLGVFMSPDGSHVLVGTAYENGRGDAARKVTFFTKTGKPVATQFRKLTGAGYKLIASIKTTEPTKGYAVTYSATEWQNIAADLESQRLAALGTAQAMEEQLQQAGYANREEEKNAVGSDENLANEQAREIGDEVLSASVEEDISTRTTTGVLATDVVVKGFTVDHAGAIYDALVEDGADIEEDVMPALAESKRAVAGVKLAVSALTKAGRTAEKAVAEVRKYIYEVYKGNAGSGKEAFARSLLQGINSARSEAVAESGAGNQDSGPSQSGARAEEGGSGGEGQGAASTAEAVEAAAAQTDPNPTEAQKESGNYRKGHVTIDGLEITIENAKGSTRTGKDKDGNPWSVVVPAHYGYVKGTEGRDGDQVDVYIGPNPDSDRVFVVDQINPDTRKFDEHKALIGFNSREEAVATYVAGFSDASGAARLGEITEMTKEDFVDWVNEGDTSKPLSYGKKFRRSVRTNVGRTLSQVKTALPIQDHPALLDVQGNNSTILQRAAEWFRSVFGTTVTAADGTQVVLRNDKAYPTLTRFLLHLVQNNKTLTLDISKAETLPLIKWTLENASVRLFDHITGNRVYVSRYGRRDFHMVVVQPDGTVEYQGPYTGGKLVTQFDYGLPGRQEDFKVEWENVQQLRQSALPTTPTDSTETGPRQQAFRISTSISEERGQGPGLRALFSEQGLFPRGRKLLRNIAESLS